jgi:hypothetical protein
LTGQTPDQALAGLSRDTSADTTGALKTIFDPQKIQDAWSCETDCQGVTGPCPTFFDLRIDPSASQSP